jgi:hypothetical protein
MNANREKIPVETIPGMGEGKHKGECWRGGELKYDILQEPL